jgi:hypothetical protein
MCAADSRLVPAGASGLSSVRVRDCPLPGFLASVRDDVMRKETVVVPNRCMRQNRVMTNGHHRVVCMLSDRMSSIGTAIANDLFGGPWDIALGALVPVHDLHRRPLPHTGRGPARQRPARRQRPEHWGVQIPGLAMYGASMPPWMNPRSRWS